MRPHLILTACLFIFTSLGLGYRFLWQDEIETAERARSILESGLPKVINSQTDVSLNALGREIEDGDLHRYSPWGQFYLGALGLQMGKWLGWGSDQAVREPFVLMHAMTSGLISYGLHGLAGFPVVVSLAVGGVYGLQTNRILHHRTARYHAILDFFAALGLLALGWIRRKEKRGWVVLGVCIFVSPLVHTLGGSLLSALLGLASLVVVSNQEELEKKWLSRWVGLVFLPGLASLLLLLLLTRPWAQEAWGNISGNHIFRSITNKSQIRYALDFTLIAATFSFVFKKPRLGFSLLSLILFAYGLSGMLDFHPFSQARYYIFLPTLFLFWSIAFQPFSQLKKSWIWLHGAILLVFILGPDLTTRQYSAFQGVKIVWSDWEHSRAMVRQPLHEAIEEIGKSKKPVLIDYVPQYVNWYLPLFEVALMPDLTQKTKLNSKNSIWDRELLFPYWHLWYSDWGSGGWVCMGSCDYSASPIDEKMQYTLTSKRLNVSRRMCVQRQWSTNQWNNAPFELANKESFDPAGRPVGALTLAKVCEE